jgi:hypothetical protein
MDTVVTEPIPKLRPKAKPWKIGRPMGPATMMAASAGLGAIMAAIVVLVWAVAAGPQSIKQHESDASASPATAEPAAPQDALPPEAQGGLPGIPGLSPSGGAPNAAAAGATANPLEAFPSRPSVLSGGGGAPALAAPNFPPPPDLQTVLDKLAPYVAPAVLSQAVTPDAIVGLVGNIGGWATAAAVATANDATTLLGNIILASAYAGNNPLAIFTGAANAAASVMNLPAQVVGMVTNPLGALDGVASKLAVSMPALDALSKLPQMPAIGLPQLPPPPPIGLPQIGLPPPPPIGLPQLPPPPAIGLPPPPPPLLLAALVR